MALKLTNNATSLLAGTILAADGSLSITTPDDLKFPVLGAGDWCPVVVVDSAGNREIMRCTARSGTLLTVTRGQEGTVARGFTANVARVDVRLTAQAILEMNQDAGLLATNIVPDIVLPVRLRTTPRLCPGAGTGGDCNSVTETGRYYTTTTTTNTPQSPGASEYGYLWVDAFDANYQYQEWQDFDTAKRWGRRRQGAAWTAWYELLLTEPGVPAGAIMDWPGLVDATHLLPSGWLLCYGQTLTRSPPYDKLFTALGGTSSPWGLPSGTTFSVPDLRGRVTAGQDDMGGVSANRLIGTISGLNGDTLAASGGVEGHILAESQMPSHNHGLATATAKTASGGGDHGHNVAGSVASAAAGFGFAAGSGNVPAANPAVTGLGEHVHTLTGDTDNTGSSLAHTNVQPTTIVNKIIKY